MKFELKKPNINSGLIAHLWKSSTRDLVNPTRDWVTGLSAAALVFVGGVAYIAFDFHTQFGAASDEQAIEVQPLIYRGAEVKAYAERYAQRERDFETLRKDRRYVPPPAVVVPADTVVEDGSETETPLADTPPTE